MDGSFGTLTLADGVYNLEQVHFHFPSTHTMNGGPVALGEMHLVHRRAPNKMAVIAILLQLPAEAAPATEDTTFFQAIDLENIPEPGEPRAVPNSVNFDAFSRQLGSANIALPCSENIKWFMVAEPAHVTGAMVHAQVAHFVNDGSEAPNADTSADASQSSEGAGEAQSTDTIFSTGAQTGEWQPLSHTLSSAAQVRAYATGEWLNQFVDPSPATPANNTGNDNR
jgi:hypothetical protein